MLKKSLFANFSSQATLDHVCVQRKTFSDLPHCQLIWVRGFQNGWDWSTPDNALFPIIYVFQGHFIPAGPIAANFLDGTYSKHGAGWNKAMLINSICNILLHLSHFKIAFVGLFLSSKLSKNGRSPWHVSTSVNQTSCYGMSDLRFGHELVSIKLAILATTSWFTQAVEMNMEHPKNGTERALILHSWLISKWTWASRHIFRISHTERFPPSPSTWVRSYICQISPNRRLPSVGPRWVFGHCLSPAQSIHLLLLMLNLNTSLTALVRCWICICGNVAITFETCPLLSFGQKRRLSVQNLTMLT